ncbi:NTP transferase domain-containing protein [Carboxydochorda subterranea]|uniref:NTP transferase domain-containing protein n=1 Tax=Carboxydichorda subterranea TaxID=3109565 RepID=A0ABZ1BW70_9FIRM|nr:NTP transferase domain-containing protein [Limnochorda sp. L945t]WRP17050.1 NTP transferase domain-containing protein [Limnochorda sp. L945t]
MQRPPDPAAWDQEIALAPRLDAVVLAAAGNRGRLREVSEAPYEALIPIEGRPMVAYVVEALAQARRVSGIVVVGPDPVVEAARKALGEPVGTRLKAVAPGARLIDNLERGLAEATTEHVLVVTSDIPLVKAHMVDDFVRRCEQSPEMQDVWYSIVERRMGEHRYPGVKRTWVKLADGSFTGGNVFVVRRDIVELTRPILTRAIEARKSPLTLARLLGLRAVVRFMLGRLTVAEAERRVGRMLDIRGKAVATPYAEIGIDVDKPSDLELARRFLGPPAQAGAGA